MKDNSFYIFGKKPVLEVLQQKPALILQIFLVDKIDEIVELAKENKVQFKNVDQKFARQEIKEGNVQGVFAKIKKFEYEEFSDWTEKINLEKNNLVLILNNIEDVHNFGAIIRTAAAVGVTGIIVEKNHQAPVNGTVFKTSAGNINTISIVEVSNINQAIEKLKKIDFWIYGVDMKDKKSQGGLMTNNIFKQEFDKNSVLILGSEEKGISKLVKENCDFLVSIPMENEVESLNVSVAGAIAMYE